MDAGLRLLVEADIIVLATPVDEAHDVLRQIGAMDIGARLVMDVGSTKSNVLATATAHGLGERFVGSHPLTGDHLSGWRASRGGLFEGARVFVCPTDLSTAGSLALATAFWKLLGARPERIDALEHDQRLGWSSHLPHLVSTALAVALHRAGIHRSELGPGGRDVTRLAGSSPVVWVPIVRENATVLGAALAAVEDELRTMRLLLVAPESAILAERLIEARTWFGATDGNAMLLQRATLDGHGLATPSISVVG